MVETLIAHARTSDPDTSHAAAAVITPHLTELQQRVERVLRAAGPTGMTDLETTIEIGDETLSTIRSRRNELTGRNIVLDSGMRRTTGDSARQRIVWRHRDHHPNPPPLCEPARPATKEEIDEAHGMVTSLRAGARQMRHEGRTAFADELERAAELMVKLLA